MSRTPGSPRVLRAAVVGAGVGIGVVLAASAVILILSGAPVELMGVAAVAAFFGGTGFGGMLGAVLAAVGGLSPGTESVEGPVGELQPRSVSS